MVSHRWRKQKGFPAWQVFKASSANSTFDKFSRLTQNGAKFNCHEKITCLSCRYRLRILNGRIMSAHLKDLNEKSPNAHDVPYGTGVSDIPGILKELKRQHFAGNISIEYEYHWTNSLPEVAQCIGFVRGYGAKK
jgi:hypothetical protein